MDNEEVALEVPLLLIIGTSVGENWLILPDGIELPYLFWLCTGGSYWILIPYKFINYYSRTNNYIDRLTSAKYTKYHHLLNSPLESEMFKILSISVNWFFKFDMLFK